jgi:LacI family transcriptional regulator
MSSDGDSPVTLHDVAREAGVSLATASRSLNGSARTVNEAYKERVLAAAALLNYTPNLSAQATAKGSTTTVVLLVSDIADPYFSSIAAGVMRAADDAGLVVTIAATGRDSGRELTLVRAMRGQRPRVMILAGSRATDDPLHDRLTAELQAFEKTGGRVSLISGNDLPFATVLLDNRAGATRLAESLVGLGYRRFAALSGPRSIGAVIDRLTGFLDGLARHGVILPDERIVETDFTRDGGYLGMQSLIAAGLGETELVFAVNDVMAVGAMSALRDAGLVPGVDVAIAGYDDIQTARDIIPALTSVRIPLEEVGRRALELALGTGESEGGSIPVPAEVIVRASTPHV